MGSGILSARLSWCIPVGFSPTQVKPGQQPATATEAPSAEVTKLMEPAYRRCWAVAQVNIISPETDGIIETKSRLDREASAKTFD